MNPLFLVYLYACHARLALYQGICCDASRAVTQSYRVAIRTVASATICCPHPLHYRAPINAGRRGRVNEVRVSTLSTFTSTISRFVSSLDNGFATMGVGLFVVAFVRLRYSQPHLERLYRVPGGACGAWSAAVLVLIVVAIALYSAANGDESPIYVLPLITATPAVLVIFAGTRKWLNGGSARFFFLDSSNLSNPREY